MPSEIRLQAGNTASAVRVENIFCIGRNYAAHIAELGNRPSENPVVFLKPTSALNTSQTIQLPAHSADVHFEAELVLLLGKGGKNIAEADALAYISGVALGLDLTARDLQNQNKKLGLPWATAKGFDDSASLSHFVPLSQVGDLNSLEFFLHVNGEQRQHGKVSNMIYSVPQLVAYLSRVFTLQAGDLVYTGTPEGVAALKSGDQLQMTLPGQIDCEFSVA